MDLSAPIEVLWDSLVRIEEFPEFMDDVQWIRVLKRSGNRRLAAWSVLLRGSVLQWSEEAVLDAAGHRIQFEQIDGDLSIFRGSWQLAGLASDRTRASLHVEFEIGIPLMAQMLNPVAKQSLESNATRMFKALEERGQMGSAMHMPG